MTGGGQPKRSQPQQQTTPTPAPVVKKVINKGVSKTPNILTGPAGTLGTAETAKNKLGL